MNRIACCCRCCCCWGGIGSQSAQKNKKTHKERISLSLASFSFFRCYLCQTVLISTPLQSRQTYFLAISYTHTHARTHAITAIWNPSVCSNTTGECLSDSINVDDNKPFVSLSLHIWKYVEIYFFLFDGGITSTVSQLVCVIISPGVSFFSLKFYLFFEKRQTE